jgi:hypothetical protein
MDKTRTMYNILDGKPKRRDHLGDLGICVRMILKYIFQNWAVNIHLEAEF